MYQLLALLYTLTIPVLKKFSHKGYGILAQPDLIARLIYAPRPARSGSVLRHSRPNFLHSINDIRLFLVWTGDICTVLQW